MKKWEKRSTARGLCLSGLLLSLPCLRCSLLPVQWCLGSGVQCYLERAQ